MSREECCGTCKWHKHDNEGDAWICTNPDSEYYVEYTEYRDCCEEHEERG